MKKLLFLLAIIVSMSIHGQQSKRLCPPDYLFSIVCEFSNSQSQAFDNISQWMMSELSDNPNDVYCDTINKKLLAKTSVRLPDRHDYSNSTESSILNFSISCEVREGRFKLEVRDMSLQEWSTSTLFGFTDTEKEDVDIATVFDFDNSPWMNRIKLYEREKSEIEARDMDKLSKKEKRQLKTRLNDIAKNIESEYSSIEIETKKNNKRANAVMDFLNGLSEKSIRIANKALEQW